MKQRTHTSESKAQRRQRELGPENYALVERVRAMSSVELAQSLVSAGIHTPDGKLTDRYKD